MEMVESLGSRSEPEAFEVARLEGAEVGYLLEVQSLAKQGGAG